MKYDIFISYKRLDKDKVFSIKDFIERNTGCNCWIDLDGIESDAQFADIIIKAINNAKVFLFMYSNTHAKIENFDEDWTVREIMFAQMKKKRIVFVNIDDTPLTDRFYFMFATKQQVVASSDMAMRKLCSDIKQWIGNDDGKQIEQERIEREKLEAEEKKREEKEEKEEKSKKGLGSLNGHEYVDLGLPSGLKWATCNVGANKPEEYGNYYAWGEIKTKNTYTEGNSRTLYKTMKDISGNHEYDAATANWGGSWRIPTIDELNELRINCSWTWITQNGVKGYKVTSKKNGNSIFLPAAGFRLGASLSNAGNDGYYWSSTPYGNPNANYLKFDSSSRGVYYGGRYCSCSIRPVLKNKKRSAFNLFNSFNLFSSGD